MVDSEHRKALDFIADLKELCEQNSYSIQACIDWFNLVDEDGNVIASFDLYGPSNVWFGDTLKERISYIYKDDRWEKREGLHD
jgi:hypothetical protein